MKKDTNTQSQRSGNKRRSHRPRTTHATQKPDVSERTKITPLGGLGEVGRNMYSIEYGEDIVIIDIGLRFPEENMPGIDYLIPNISYLKDKIDNIRGIFVSHSHMDHLGAIPFLIEDLKYPQIYALPLTNALIKKRHDEYKKLKPLKQQNIKIGQRISCGEITVQAFHQNHSVPDSAGFFIETPAGNILYTGDFKFDFKPVGDKPADLLSIALFGQKGVDLLMADSTDAELEGHSLTEQSIQDNIETIFQKAKGRIIVGTFASLLTRIQEIVNLSEKYNRHVVLEGYSMKTNTMIARKLGHLKVKRGTLIEARHANKYPPEKITILGTGAQGEDNAVMMRIVSGEHRFFKIEKGDSLVFSSSVIPGNEASVQNLKDNIYKQGGIVYHKQTMDIHSGGHAKQEDLKLMHALTKPKFFMPIHGNYSMLYKHASLAKEGGMSDDRIAISENGKSVLLGKNSVEVAKDKAASEYVMVDGLGIGDVGNVVLRDRQTMSEDGMFVIVATVSRRTKKVRDNVDVISRGFVYLKEAQDLLDKSRDMTKKTIQSSLDSKTGANWAKVKSSIREKLSSYLFQQTQRRPLILPVIIEVE